MLKKDNKTLLSPLIGHL